MTTYTTMDRAHVLLDALALLQKAIDGGSRPWLDYDGDGGDPKTTEAGYRALLGDARTMMTGAASTTRAALPILVNADGDAECPHCGHTGEFIEVDRAERWNRAELIVKDGKVAAANWSTGQGDFEHDHYKCDDCNGPIALPDNIKESWN